MNHSLQQKIDIFIIFMVTVLTGYAVFAKGLTSADTTLNFDYALGGILIFWVLVLIIQRRLPAVNGIVMILTSVLMLLGWISGFNSNTEHNWEAGFFSISDSKAISWLPSSLNRTRSLNDMKHLSLVILGGWLISDLCRNRGGRKLIMEAFVLIGLAFAVLGLFLKASGNGNMLYFDEAWKGSKSFTSYRYHGNAVTFLNYCWPVAGALFLSNLFKQVSPLRKALFSSAPFFIFASIFVNTSKMGHLMAPFLLLAFLISYRKAISAHLTELPRKRTILAVMVVLFAVGIGSLITISFSQSAERWNDLSGSLNTRLSLYETCVSLVKTSGVFGLGPGTFSTVFPYAFAAEGKTSDFGFYKAHQDYLQGLIEWGWLGFLLWMSVLVNIVIIGISRIKMNSFYSAAILIAILSAAVQALVDFPVQIASLQWVGIMLCGILTAPLNRG